MTELETARRVLRTIADGLEILELTLVGLEATLPVSSAEAEQRVDIEVMDVPTELRAVTGSVLHDSIGPAKRAIRHTLAQTESTPSAGDTKP
jgi:hypothetical protein